MGVIKRYIHPTTDYCSPNIDSTTDRFLILRNLSQANNTGLIGQLSTLFEYTQEIFSELLEEASSTASRIQSLGERVAVLQDTLPSVESQAPELLSLTNVGSSYSNKSPEDACQFLPEKRVLSISHQYEECMPPPNLSLLDPYAGESCLKKYTNPMFFFESWAEEQDRMYREAKKKRARRRKVRAAAATTTKIAVKHVELRRNKYSAMGQEFAGMPVGSVPTRTASDVHTSPDLTPVHSARLEPSPRQAISPRRSPRIASPPQEVEPPLSARSSKSKKDKKDKKKDKKEKKEKKVSKKDKKSQKTPSASELPPPPSEVAPPPPPNEAPAAPAPTKNVAPPPPPANVPPPPAPAPPPPPPDASKFPPPPTAGGGLGGLADQLGKTGLKSVPQEATEKKPEGKRSALLSAIQAGTQLRKVEVEEPADKKQNDTYGGFDVSRILARRAAMEFSDEEDNSFDDDDWED